jgi:HSP20 family protein
MAIDRTEAKTNIMYTAKRPQTANTLSSVFDELFNSFPASAGQVSISKVPVNISEDANGYKLELQVPGRTKEAFTIKLEEGILTISAEAKPLSENNLKVIRNEFTAPAFKRSFSVDKKIDADNIQAKYENGILTVYLPKKEEVKNAPKQIVIT